jgi:radical SAM superfamily enzyme YgiQ (UPF0313 family)
MMEVQADILLVYPPHRKIDFVSSIPHLSAYLKKKGFRVDVLDSPTLRLDEHDIVDYVGYSKPRSVGISIPFTPMARSGLKLVQKLGKFYPSLPLIVGGVHPTLCPEEFTDYSFVCSGDGEVALAVFVNWVKGNHPMPDRILKISTPVHEIEAPDWDCVEANKYQMITPNGKKAFPVQGCVGCPYDCIFCSSNQLFEGKVSFKSLDQVHDEIQAGIEKFGTRNIVFRDENITLNRGRFRDLCDYLKANKISWWAQTRANLINQELADLAKRSGCIGLSIGVETGDAEIMKLIKKGITLEDAEEAFEILRNAGLRSASNFMIGHPWDTPESIRKSIEFAHKIDSDYIGVQIATPFPGTEFRKEALKMGSELKEEWGNYLTSKQGNFQPPGMTGYDLEKIRIRFEWEWFTRKPSRFFNVLFDHRSIRSKIRFIRRMFSLMKSSKGREL